MGIAHPTMIEISIGLIRHVAAFIRATETGALPD